MFTFEIFLKIKFRTRQWNIEKKKIVVEVFSYRLLVMRFVKLSLDSHTDFVSYRQTVIINVNFTMLNRLKIVYTRLHYVRDLLNVKLKSSCKIFYTIMIVNS